MQWEWLEPFLTTITFMILKGFLIKWGKVLRKVDHTSIIPPLPRKVVDRHEMSISSNPKHSKYTIQKVASLSSWANLCCCMILSWCKRACLSCVESLLPSPVQCNSPSHGLAIVPLSVHQFQKHDAPSNVVFFYEASFPWPRQIPRCDAPLTFPCNKVYSFPLAMPNAFK